MYSWLLPLPLFVSSFPTGCAWMPPDTTVYRLCLNAISEILYIIVAIALPPPPFLFSFSFLRERGGGQIMKANSIFIRCGVDFFQSVFLGYPNLKDWNRHTYPGELYMVWRYKRMQLMNYKKNKTYVVACTYVSYIGVFVRCVSTRSKNVRSPSNSVACYLYMYV